MRNPVDLGTRGHTLHRVGESLAAVLLLSDLARVIGVTNMRAWQLERDHEFDRFELLPRIGKRRRYSGKLVQAWLDGELAPEPMQTVRPFNRKRRG